jgi:hypothetical protein
VLLPLADSQPYPGFHRGTIDARHAGSEASLSCQRAISGNFATGSCNRSATGIHAPIEKSPIVRWSPTNHSRPLNLLIQQRTESICLEGLLDPEFRRSENDSAPTSTGRHRVLNDQRLQRFALEPPRNRARQGDREHLARKIVDRHIIAQP